MRKELSICHLAEEPYEAPVGALLGASLEGPLGASLRAPLARLWRAQVRHYATRLEALQGHEAHSVQSAAYRTQLEFAQHQLILINNAI